MKHVKQYETVNENIEERLTNEELEKLERIIKNGNLPYPVEEFGRKCFYEGREIKEYDHNKQAIFTHPTYNGYLRYINKF